MNRFFLGGLLIGVATTLIAVALALAYFADATVLAGIQAAGSVAVAFSAITAYRLYRANVIRHQQEDRRAVSEIFLKESIALLNRAYDTFTRFGDNPPKNDRLLWLSTARMIVRFQNMRAKITEPDHQVIVDENEEHIRLKFYTLLATCKDQLTSEYFMPGGQLSDPNAVARNSVAVIFAFSKWPENMQDPLENVDDKELFARGVVPIDFLGVVNYLEHDQEYWEEIERRKATARE
jgi:hypothetical protein